MTGSPEEAFDKAFELAARLAATMQGALAERGLTPSRAEVIYVLARDGELMQRALADALRCTPRHVTSLVDQLQGAGLVRRLPHPHDRRAVAVSLTPKGSVTAQWINDSRRSGARAVLGDVPSDDMAAFVRVADLILGAVAPSAT
ncbi:MarR family winged helix-turn-helix transcriptional regulator [Amycolatopsis halotolerans]|uniref:MarR family winged helix-turn-helix transcriptional regulator n=1 Tax=Amycolatopsis halotolerans TaxID=330083 RepID=A0ABV7Q8G0_9PSEU